MHRRAPPPLSCTDDGVMQAQLVIEVLIRALLIDICMRVPGGELGVPGGELGVPGGELGVPGGELGVPGGELGVPGGDLGVPGGELGVPGGELGVPGGELGVPGGELGVPGGDLGVPGGIRMPVLLVYNSFSQPHILLLAVPFYAGALLAEAKAGTSLTEGGPIPVLLNQGSPLPILILQRDPLHPRPVGPTQGLGTGRKVQHPTIIREALKR